MRRRRVTYRPSKANGVFGVIWGGIFVLIGLVVVIPSFGAFGILWTLMAGGITVYNAYMAFGKKYVGPEINIEEDIPEQEMYIPEEQAAHTESIGLSVEARLEQLRRLYDSGLIDNDEYQAKKKDILADL